ncbi:MULTISPECIES: hypothetical protein [Bacillus]|uniref:hypothetical protein n=1 Tax=Bacillus TaxID=1386 RepID=UPI000BB742C5|nr:MULTISPECIES: hypothetical protein [Bacillus]
MNRNTSVIITLLFLILLGSSVTYIVVTNSNKNVLEARRLEMINYLDMNFEKFAPELADFVDENKTIITSVISPGGLVNFECFLVRNEEPFGIYKVLYDIKNQIVITKELEVTNPKYVDEWREFQKKH